MKNSLEKFSKSNIYKTFSRSTIVSPIILFVFVISTVFSLGFLWYLRSGNKLRFHFGNLVFRAQYKLEVCEHLKKDISEVWNYSLDILASIVNIFTIESASLTALGALLVAIYINVRTETKDYNSTSQARKAYIRAYRKFLLTLIYLLSSIFYTHGLVRLIDSSRIVSVELKNISQPWIYFFFGAILIIIYNIFGKTADMYSRRVSKFLRKNSIVHKKFDNKIRKNIGLEYKIASFDKIIPLSRGIRHDNYIKRFSFILSGYLGVRKQLFLVAVFALVNSLIPIFTMYFQLKHYISDLAPGDQDEIINKFFQSNMTLYIFLGSLFISLTYLFTFPRLFLYFYLCKEYLFNRCHRITYIILMLCNFGIVISYGGGYIETIEILTQKPYAEISYIIQMLNLIVYCIFPPLAVWVFKNIACKIYKRKYLSILYFDKSAKLKDVYIFSYGIFTERLLYLWGMALSAYEDEILFREEDDLKENSGDIYDELYKRFKIIQTKIILNDDNFKDELPLLPPYLN